MDEDGHQCGHAYEVRKFDMECTTRLDEETIKDLYQRREDLWRYHPDPLGLCYLLQASAITLFYRERYQTAEMALTTESVIRSRLFHWNFEKIRECEEMQKRVEEKLLEANSSKKKPGSNCSPLLCRPAARSTPDSRQVSLRPRPKQK